MLRISQVDPNDEHSGPLLRLEGRVSGRWVRELRRACQDAMAGQDRDPRLILDLAEVSFIDADGVALFLELAAHDVSLLNCSLFVAEQLKEVRRC